MTNLSSNMKNTTRFKILAVLAMGLLLGWVNDYFFRRVCGFTLLENGGKMPPYEPRLVSIFLIAGLFFCGAMLSGLVLWAFNKWCQRTNPIQLPEIIDADGRYLRTAPLFIDQLVLGGAILLGICLAALAGERFF
jgi:hypothetical protein